MRVRPRLQPRSRGRTFYSHDRWQSSAAGGAAGPSACEGSSDMRAMLLGVVTAAGMAFANPGAAAPIGGSGLLDALRSVELTEKAQYCWTEIRRRCNYYGWCYTKK